MIADYTRRVLLTGLLGGLVACSDPSAPDTNLPDGCSGMDIGLEGPCSFGLDAVSVNDIQAVGSHNSYKIAIPAPELAMIAQSSPEVAMSLEYSHLPLTVQLNMGLRQLEVDVIRDPEGGRYADPMLPRLSAGLPGAVAYDATEMGAAGYKVLHTQDVDVRSHCATFVACLRQIDAWSRANSDHVPLLVLVNLKFGSLGIPDTVDALEFDAEAFEALDAELRSVFGPDRLITPDTVRGTAQSLRDGTRAGGWPSLDVGRGRLIFALDTDARNVETYLRGKPSLHGLPMFVNSVSETAAHAAYFTMNDPIRDGETVKRLVSEGFLVRTRADADTVEARSGNTARRDAAFASGAQYVSTDYYMPHTAWSDYVVTLPGGSAARCNPVRDNASCLRITLP